MAHDSRYPVIPPDWYFLRNYGLSGELYARGNKVKILDRNIRAIIYEYETARPETPDPPRGGD